MTDRIQVCYYITGHGLGHATRSMELIRALLETDRFAVPVVTPVKAEFFHDSLKDFNISPTAANGESIFTIHDRNLDTGAVQADVFVVDAMQTLSRYYEQIHLHRQQLIDNEVAWLKEHKIKLVLVDAIPLGCLVGSLAGAKTVLVSNFSWDFCFKEMLATVTSRGLLSPEVADRYSEMVVQCEADSSACDHYLQLPGATPWPTGFPAEKVIPGPLIARQPRSHSLREERGVSAEAKVLLLGFGGHSAEWHLEDSFLPAGWECFVLGAKAGDMPSGRFHALGPASYVPDLIHAADCVLGKLGYGFVSECVTSGTALIYVPRVDWPEERYLEKLLMEEYEAGVRMPQQDFVSGAWAAYIEQAVALRGHWMRAGVDFSTASTQIVETLSSLLHTS